jgi:L-seryl-tRNA(Ser) seleniumtransferase
MYDLGSGNLIDLKPYGIHTEPSVQEILRSGVDVITFSGDKLLGGPQGGIIVGKKDLIEKIRKNPLARAVRVDKMTIAAFEATLMEYLDPDQAMKNIPVLDMLFQPVEAIRMRARKLAAGLRRKPAAAEIRVIKDISKAGGGSLPEAALDTYVVAVAPSHISVNDLEKRLRSGAPPVIARIREHALLLDARTIRNNEILLLVKIVSTALSKA